MERENQKYIGMGCDCGKQYNNFVKNNKKLNKITSDKILICSQFSNFRQ